MNNLSPNIPARYATSGIATTANGIDAAIQTVASRDRLVIDAHPGELGHRAAGDCVFLGTGLVTAGRMGDGLAFDVLAMMLVAEEIRGLAGLTEVNHLVADKNAFLNGFCDPAEVGRVGRESAAELRHVAAKLGFPSYNVLLASEIDDDLLPELFDQVPATIGHRYVRQEVADIEWARRRFGAAVKVGWAISPKPSPKGNDERMFDRAHATAFGTRVPALYVAPGRNDVSSRPRVSPYTFLSGEQRFRLRPGEGDPVPGPASKGMRRHLNHITDRVERLMGVEIAGDVPTRVAAVQHFLFDDFTQPSPVDGCFDEPIKR